MPGCAALKIFVFGAEVPLKDNLVDTRVVGLA